MRNWAVTHRPSLRVSNYTMKADPKRAGGRRQYFLNLRPRVLDRYRKQTEGNFDIVVIGDEDIETDYFVIPYRRVAELLTAETLSTEGRGGIRWVIQLLDDQFIVFPGDGRLEVSITGCYKVHHTGDKK